MKLARRRGPGLGLALALALTGCSGDDGETDTGLGDPFFPEGYQASYTEVRDCRGSGDHNLNKIRILASPEALGPYQDRDAPFPEGAVVLKEEHDFGDMSCSGPILRWTVMRKLAAGSAPDTLDWEWQDVDDARVVIEADGAGCVNCHTGCGVAPEGHDGTCSIPP